MTKLTGENDWLRVTNGVVDASQATKSVPCDTDGRFHLPPIDDPFVCFIADETGYRELTDAALFGTNAVALQPWSQLEGEVLVGGAPAAGLQVTMYQSAFPEGMFPSVMYSNAGLTDAAGRYSFQHCVAGQQSLSVDYGAMQRLGGIGICEKRHFDLAVGESFVQDFGRDTADVIGRVVVSDPKQVDYTRSRISLLESGRTAPEGGSAHLVRTSHYTELQESGQFRIQNVTPSEGTVVVLIWIRGETTGWSHTKEIPITPEMFEGKSSRDPIDLGEILISDDAE
jgi:hypothetical protein